MRFRSQICATRGMKHRGHSCRISSHTCWVPVPVAMLEARGLVAACDANCAAEADDFSLDESTSPTTWSLALDIVGMRWAVRKLCCLTVSTCVGWALLADTSETAVLTELSLELDEDVRLSSSRVLDLRRLLVPIPVGGLLTTMLPDNLRWLSPRRGLFVVLVEVNPSRRRLSSLILCSAAGS